MENTANNPYLSFLSSKYLANELFDVSMNENDFVEKAMRIWRSIGNVTMAIHEYEATIDESCIILMPCNTEKIEAVTTESCEFNKDDVVFIHDASNDNLYIASNFVPDAISGRSPKTIQDLSRQEITPRGQYVNYDLLGSRGSYTMKFNKDLVGTTVFITYRAIVVGNDGLPLINSKEQEALAYRVAYELTQKNAFKGDQLAMNLLGAIRQDSDIKMAAAKIPEYISQNALDSFLRAMTRHDRKQYGYGFKPVI